MEVLAYYRDEAFCYNMRLWLTKRIISIQYFLVAWPEPRIKWKYCFDTFVVGGHFDGSHATEGMSANN